MNNNNSKHWSINICKHFVKLSGCKGNAKYTYWWIYCVTHCMNLNKCCIFKFLTFNVLESCTKCKYSCIAEKVDDQKGVHWDIKRDEWYTEIIKIRF